MEASPLLNPNPATAEATAQREQAQAAVQGPRRTPRKNNLTAWIFTRLLSSEDRCASNIEVLEHYLTTRNKAQHQTSCVDLGWDPIPQRAES